MSSARVHYPFRVHKQKINGDIEMAYVDEGSGEPLLFIHGLASYLLSWRKNIPGLSKDFRCIAVDLPGNGLSSRGDYPYTMFFYAECVANLLARLGLKEVNIVGHSMGGQIAIILALRYPTLVKKLVLSAPAGFETFTAHDKLLFQQMMLLGNFMYADRMHLNNTIRDSFYQYPEEAEAMEADMDHIFFRGHLQAYRNMVTASVNGMMNEQVSDYLPAITCPVIVFFGLNDRLIPNKMLHPGNTRAVAERGVARLKNAELVLFDQCGHFVHWEKANDFNTRVKLFLQYGSPNQQK